MIGKKTVGNILFLPGVFRKDCKKIEDFMMDRLADTSESITYDKIPSVFTTLEAHPRQTNLKCWSCHMNFKTRPWFEPLTLSKTSMSIKGNFCGPCCVASYIKLYTSSLPVQHDKLNMLKHIYEIYTGIRVITIRAAPPHTCMKEYGGDTTPEAYIKMLEQIETTYMIDQETVNFGKMNIGDFMKIVNE
jgi:hypothetical protein